VQILTHEPSQAFRKRLETIARHESTEPGTYRTVSDVLEWMGELVEKLFLWGSATCRL